MKTKTWMLLTIVVFAVTLGLLLWRTQQRFTFSGKVVDQHENAISGARILFHFGSKGVTCTSDARGFFFYRGPDLASSTLGVTVEKEGYAPVAEDGHKTGSSRLFEYSDAAGAVHRPDKDGPVVFHLYKPDPVKP